MTSEEIAKGLRDLLWLRDEFNNYKESFHVAVARLAAMFDVEEGKHRVVATQAEADREDTIAAMRALLDNADAKLQERKDAQERDAAQDAAKAETAEIKEARENADV